MAAAHDSQARMATLERALRAANRELQWAQLKIQVQQVQIQTLEERLRRQRIQWLGPHSETLSDLQLELLADEEPGATAEEVEAETRREPLPGKPRRERPTHPGRRALPEHLPRLEQVIRCEEPSCRSCGGETTVIGYDQSEQLDHEPARWFVRVIQREKRACGKCSAVMMAELEPRIVDKGLASDRVVIETVVAKYCDHRVPRTRPTAMSAWSCERDEGRSLEAGDQGQASNHRELLSLRAMVVSVAEKTGQDPVR